VVFAKEHDLPISVKGGGHDIAGRAVEDDALMIDLSPMNAIRVDPDSKIAASNRTSCATNRTTRPRRSASPRPSATTRRPASPG